jgi:predicted MFS family arabinose efflux permease
MGEESAAPSAWWRPRAPLAMRSRAFRRLATAWVFTNLGDSALYLMAAVWVKDITGSDAAAASVLIVMGLPALVAPFLGMLADRFSRRRLLIISNAVMVLVVSSLFLVESAKQLVIVYIAIFLYGAVGYLTAAAQSGLVRDLLDDEALPSANGLLTTIDQGLRLVSPLVGTALYVLVGPFSVVGMTAACFATTAVILTTVHVEEVDNAETETEVGYWRELTAGFTHLARTPVLNRATFALGLSFGATGLANVVVFPALEQGLQVSTAALGSLVSAQGAGAIVGGLVAAPLVARLGEMRVMSGAMILLALSGLPLAGASFGLALAGMAVLGFSISIIIVGFATLRQRRTPRALQGRAAAASNIAVNVPQVVISTAAAAVIVSVDYRLLVLVMAALMLASSAVAGIAPGRVPPATAGDEG